MKIELKNIKMFTKLMKAVKPVIRSDEFHLVINKDKMTLDAINSTRTGMVSLNVSSKFFEGYDVDKQYILPLPYDQFMKQVNMFSDFKLMNIEFDEENSRINFYAKEGKKRRKNHIQLISPLREYVDPKNVKISYSVMFSINLKDLDKALLECEYFDQMAVDLKFTDLEFILIAGADDKSGGTEIAWTLGEDIDVVLAEPMEIQFTTILLTEITSKIKSLSENVIISMHPVAPIKLSITFPNGSLIYHVVPNGLEDD